MKCTRRMGGRGTQPPTDKQPRVAAQIHEAHAHYCQRSRSPAPTRSHICHSPSSRCAYFCSKSACYTTYTHTHTFTADLVVDFPRIRHRAPPLENQESIALEACLEA